MRNKGTWNLTQAFVISLLGTDLTCSPKVAMKPLFEFCSLLRDSFRRQKFNAHSGKKGKDDFQMFYRIADYQRTIFHAYEKQER